MITIITFILVLAFLILVHEFGHFWAARKVGIHVQQFSIGFPPKIFSKTIGATEYLLSFIPFGGYVKLKGQNIDDENPDEPDNYAAKTIAQRFLVLFSGAGMNFITALVMMIFVYMIGVQEYPHLQQPPVIAAVQSGSLADQAGIQPDDRIIMFNQHPVTTWEKFGKELTTVNNKEFFLTFQRDQKTFTRSFQNDLVRSNGFGWSMQIDPIVGEVMPNSPAALAGVQSGDRILAINHVAIKHWQQIHQELQKKQPQTVTIKILRQQETITLQLVPSLNPDTQTWMIGVRTPTYRKSYGLLSAIKLGTQKVYYTGKETLYFLTQLIQGKTRSEDLGGPIMIAKIIGSAAQKGISDLLFLISFISLQLGILNLLPFPALDGGHIFLLLIEKIRGENLSIKIREKINQVGFVILISLMIYITIQDSLRLM